MKKLLYLLCFLPLCLSAQTPEQIKNDTLPQRTSYMSFFGKNKTEYSMCIVLYVVNFTPNGKPIDAEPCKTIKYIFSEREQVFNGKHYKYEENLHQDSTFKFERDILLREDTVLGRLYRYFPELDTEVVLCDMSLQQGDTFWIPRIRIPSENFPDYYYNEANKPIIVDTVFYVDGVKHIIFQYIKYSYWGYNSIFYDEREGVCKEHDIPLSFIEGIGPSYGLGYIMNINYFFQPKKCLPLMLCLHKDDSLAFMLHEPTGCELNVDPKPQIKEAKRTTLTLQPNPAQDYILLRNEDASDLGGEIIITDAIGRVLRHCTMEEAEMRINTSRYSSGTYFVRYRSQNGVQILKFVTVE